MKSVDLSEVCSRDIKRTGEIAEVIWAYYDDDPAKPVRLMGFIADSSLSDFEIYELALAYYNNLVDAVQAP